MNNGSETKVVMYWSYDWKSLQIGHILVVHASGHVLVVRFAKIRFDHILVAKIGNQCYDQLSPCGGADHDMHLRSFGILLALPWSMTF